MAGNNLSLVSLPIFGYPGPVFHIIHIIALMACGSSFLVSLSIILYSFITENRKNNPRVFRRWCRGERLVVYLAFFDLNFSVTHLLDHAYIYITVAIPPDELCRAFAFFVVGSAVGQWMMILCIALITCAQVFVIHHISLGKYDWRLLAFSAGVPYSFVIVGVILEYIGPNGAWCVFDMRTKLGVIMSQVTGVLIMVVFCICTISYITIWIRIRTSAAQSTDDTVSKERRQRINRSGRIMMIFVLAFLVQWWPWTVQAICAYMAETPPLWIIVAVASLCNSGGVINAFAYTIMRIKYRNQRSEIQTQVRSQEYTVTESELLHIHYSR